MATKRSPRPTGSAARMRMFISHIFEEAPLATILKEHIARDFLGAVEIFVSSDADSISAGSNWLDSIRDALQSSDLLVVICSPASIRRPWINFESGAAWTQGLPLIPVCHSGVEPHTLPMPLVVMQAVRASDPAGITRIYKAISRHLKFQLPSVNFDAIAAEAQAFEASYLPKLAAPEGVRSSREDEARRRIIEALKDKRWRFRTIETLAYAGGLSLGETADLLRADPGIIFARSKDNGLLAGLKNRE